MFQGQVRVEFAQNEGHEKATKHCFLFKQRRPQKRHEKNAEKPYCSVQNDCMLGLILREMLTVISLQQGVCWEMFAVIWGNHWGANIDSQEQHMGLNYRIGYKSFQDRAL